jgi:hypothetical protein
MIAFSKFQVGYYIELVYGGALLGRYG